MHLHLQSSLIILCLFSSVVKSQFFYNYEETDKETPEQYSPPISVSQQPPQPNKNSEPDPPSEIIEESETPKSQRPRKRTYRRILREGTYVEPPTFAPRTFSRSIFENIGLGQAPSGVYIPQDSFLNVLRNGPPSQSSVAYNVPEQQFFVQPPAFFQNSPAVQPNVQNTPNVIYGYQNSPDASSGTAVEPNVQYVAENSASSEAEKPARQNRRRQRQRVRPSSRPEPMVDIDVLRTPPDMMQSNTPVPFQNMGTQGRSISRTRTPLLIDNYQDTTQPPKRFAPSVFQNIGLGEAPQGVDIPADSLLNVLKNTQPPREYVAPIPMTQPAQISPDLQEQELPPVEMPAPNSRRRSRQRSGESNRVSRRRPEYIADDLSQDMGIPEVRQQPRSSTSSRTSRRRTEAWYDDPMDTSAQVSRSEPQRTRITVTRTSSTNRNREERRQRSSNNM